MSVGYSPLAIYAPLFLRASLWVPLVLVAAPLAAGAIGVRLNLMVPRYLKAVGDPREVMRDPEVRYSGGRVEERSLVPFGEARLGRIGLDQWLRRSQEGA